MPELPEVETVRKGLEKNLDIFRITQLEVLRERAIASPGGSREFRKNLIGKHVGSWKRRGKYLFASLHQNKPNNSLKSFNQNSVDGFWGVHLRMTGHFQLYKKETPPCRHTRVRIWGEQGSELRFVDMRSFGQMWWVPPDVAMENIITGLKRLGPEPFSKKFNAVYLTNKLKERKISIKSALLDQSIIAGTGNIYADESLFSAGILPYKESRKLQFKEVEKLCECLVKTLKISIGKGGTSFSDFRDLEGLNGNYGGQAWVYRRNNMPCRKCGATIKKTKISGRGTHWCPVCQK